MSDENKSDEKLNATTPEFSPDSASAALRAAFLELSKSAWDIEKEIRSSSAELFDSALCLCSQGDDAQRQQR